MKTIPIEVLAQHTAILGKTGSGKTSTAKLAVEQVAGEDFRVCVLDTVKSDWWGITSSADGKRPGLPFKILGGPRGHVPLHSSAGKVIGGLVASGQLPLSIVDMADFEAGGIQRFFVDFAQALLRGMRGVLYLVIEEAHEVAPKERAGFGAENMAIHYAKKLATAGRSKGIRLIVATQRVQSLHNAVLGSCETLITHRLTTPADQEPVVKWLKANVTKEQAAEVAAALSSLPTGEGYICSGEAKLFERVKFPRFKTFDNAKTPTGDEATLDVKTAAVDQDELRALIGEAVKQAEADDPKALRAEIRRLTLALAAKPLPSAEAARDAYNNGKADGAREGAASAEKAMKALVEELRPLIKRAFSEAASVADGLLTSTHLPRLAEATAPAVRPQKIERPVVVRASFNGSGGNGGAGGEAESVSGPQRHVLKALAWWKAAGHDAPTRAQVAGIAGWKITSGHLKNVLGSLKTAGLVDYPQDGRVAMTPAGVAAAPEPGRTMNLDDGIRAALAGPQRQVFDMLRRQSGEQTRAQIADDLGWEPTSGHLKNVLGSLRTLQIIDYPQHGTVALQDWVVLA